jgi:hypothetical protein
MKDIGQLLRESDPLAHEAGLAVDEVRRMRRTVTGAASVDAGSKASTPFWPPPVLVGVTVGFALVLATIVGRHLPPPQDQAAIGGRVPAPVGEAAMPEPARRQLQFATPGGTRIIWVFDSKFSL